MKFVLFLRALLFSALATSLVAGSPIPTEEKDLKPIAEHFVVITPIAQDKPYLFRDGRSGWNRTQKVGRFSSFFDLYSCASQYGEYDYEVRMFFMRRTIRRGTPGLVVHFRAFNATHSNKTPLYDVSESEYDVSESELRVAYPLNLQLPSELQAADSLKLIQCIWERIVCRSFKV